MNCLQLTPLTTKVSYCFQLIAFALIFIVSQAMAQNKDNYWLSTVKHSESVVLENKKILTNFKLYNLNINNLQSALANAPFRNADVVGKLVYFPDAAGQLKSYHVFETSNMEPVLAAQFPQIKSYVGKGFEDPTALIYFSLSPLGLSTMLIRADQPAVIIEPYTTDRSVYAVYYKSNKTASLNQFECRLVDKGIETAQASGFTNRNSASDGNYRTYRLALSVTGEYTVYFGGTQALALAAMNNTMTRVNGVCEIDLGLHMNMIANEAAIIYTNASTDPYSPASMGAAGAWNQELQTNLTNTIGSANYDIGHLFGASGGGGNAGCIGCVCVDPTGTASLKKGSGYTSPYDGIPSGDNFDIDYVVHEMGHQFGANHTFTHSNEGTGAQMEPGSGTTIMGYAGITGATDVQPHSDPYFHAISIQQIETYIDTKSCQVTTATGNAVPTANAGLDYTIPRGTPFALTGVGTDANDAGLTYSWEQMNSGSSSTTYPSVNATSGPAFRFYSPTSSPVRYFPRLDSIKVGLTAWKWEAVPNVARTMNFRFTVRDNHAGGPANNSDDMVVTVSTASGPFVVTAPNTGVTWTTGTTQTVTWNVASTTASPVSCANVKISLSTDGGNTFPIIIAASTPNDGTEVITVPNNPTTLARIKVEAVGNIFFDMSNTNFTIISGSAVLSFIYTQAITGSNFCEGTTLNVSFGTDGPANAGNIFTAQLSNSAGSFASGVQNIGSITSINAGTIPVTIPMGTSPGTLYRVRVISSNPAIIGSDVGTLSIFGIPAAAGTISGPSTVCQGQTGVTYSVSAIANATTYNWNVPPGITITSGATTNSITISIASSATTPLSLSVAGANAGCNGTSSPNYSITVNTLPSTAGVISGTASVCQGQTAVNFNVPAINGATGYNWVLPAGATISSGANTNSITVSFNSSASSGNFTVCGTNACGSGLSSANFAVSVNTSPAAPFITAGGATSVCSPSTVNLSYTPVAGVNYQWRKDGVNIGSPNTTPYAANATGNYDVVASLTSITAQTFTNSTVFQIPDNNCTGASSTIPVSGYSSTVPTSKIFIKMNITHPWDGDLVIFLQAPSGAILGLANLVGSNGDNFTNTVFADSGSAQIPATGSPYTGLYKPWATTFTSCITSTITSFAAIGGGSINPNGNWILRTYDRAAADSGTIQNWSITFPGLSASCTSVSNVIGVTIISPPAIAGFSPGSGIIGSGVTITGSAFNGATAVKFNGVNAIFTVNNDNQISTNVPAGASSGLISVVTPCGTANSAVAFTVISNAVLNLKVYIQGYYAAGAMVPALFNEGVSGDNSITDTIQITLHQSSSPFIIDTVIIKPLATNGMVSITLPSNHMGNSYYIAIKHRNSLETWSKLPVTIGSNTSFDFTQ